MVAPSGVKLGSNPLSVVTWVMPPPVIGIVAMPVVFGKTTVWPLADTEGRSVTNGFKPQALWVQSTVTTPVFGLSVSRFLVGKECSMKTTGPLVPGKAAWADGAAATAANPAMVPVARSVPKRPRHLLLNACTIPPPAALASRQLLSSGSLQPWRREARRGSFGCKGCAGRTAEAQGRRFRSSRLPIRAHEQDLQGVEGLQALAGAEHDALERGVDQVDRNRRLLGDPVIEPAQHAAAADQVDALDDEVLGQLRRRCTEALHDRVDDGPHLLVDGLPHLFGGENDRLRQSAHQVAAPHFGLHLVLGGERRAD